MLKKLVLVGTTLSLAVSPVAAQSSATVAAPQPAVEQVEGAELRGGSGGFIAPILAITFIIFGILLATETEPFDDDGSTFPRSP